MGAFSDSIGKRITFRFLTDKVASRGVVFWLWLRCATPRRLDQLYPPHGRRQHLEHMENLMANCPSLAAIV